MSQSAQPNPTTVSQEARCHIDSLPSEDGGRIQCKRVAIPILGGLGRREAADLSRCTLSDDRLLERKPGDLKLGI